MLGVIAHLVNAKIYAKAEFETPLIPPELFWMSAPVHQMRQCGMLTLKPLRRRTWREATV